MQAKVLSAALLGIDAILVEVEVDVAAGLPSLTIVGLPSKSVDEARDRIRASLKHLGFQIPVERVTINLAPAELKKEGTAFDLPMAVGLLVASGQLPAIEQPLTSLFFGELALDGTLRAVPGVLSVAKAALKKGVRRLFVPTGNGSEAALIEGLDIHPISEVGELILHLRGEKLIRSLPVTRLTPPSETGEIDFQYVAGQEAVKRALEIAAAGGHNILLFGPPGTGKTLLARALPTILPALGKEEMLEVTQIHSAVGLLSSGELLLTRPFRSPHHTASHISVVGGGAHPRPGEVSLAHRGVLFFDELPEFPRSVLEALRQPLEDRSVVVSRVAGSLKFPADFLFVASANPCPCGWRGDRFRRCLCTQAQINRYQRKLSGPLLDRIDLHVQVHRVEEIKLLDSPVAESSSSVRERVERARETQATRFGTRLVTNSHLSAKALKSHVPLSAESREILKLALAQGKLTARSLHKVLRVARTIADLSSAERPDHQAILEAIHFRSEEVER